MENLFLLSLPLWIKTTMLFRAYKKAHGNNKKLKRLDTLSYLLTLPLCVLIVLLITVIFAFLFVLLGIELSWLCYFIIIIALFAADFAANWLAFCHLKRLRFSSILEETAFFQDMKYNPHILGAKLAEDENNIYCLMKYFRNEEKQNINDVQIEYACYTKYGDKIGVVEPKTELLDFDTIVLDNNAGKVVVNRYINCKTGDSLLLVSSDVDVDCNYNDKSLSFLGKVNLDELNEKYILYKLIEKKADSKPNFILINGCKYVLEKTRSKETYKNRIKFF